MPVQIVYIAVIVVLLCLAGIFAGLTLAFFSLKLTPLEAQVRAGDPLAKIVYPLRKKGNLLLCTLLLGNVASYTVMSLFLGSLTSGLIAGIIATALIFVFAEILPQAVFPRYALLVCARFSWLVWVSIVLFYPVSAPVAWVLDRILGLEAPVLWSREELGEIISLHEEAGDGIIDRDEERIILGALSFSEMTAADIMIPRTDVFYIRKDDALDDYLLNRIKKSGYNRIPVYDPDSGKVAGILNVSQLIQLKGGETPDRLLNASKMIGVPADIKLDDLLNLFIGRALHIAVVQDPEDRFTGIVTLEDIMEEILRREIEEKRQ